jgi:hypothetical protein
VKLNVGGGKYVITSVEQAGHMPDLVSAEIPVNTCRSKNSDFIVHRLREQRRAAFL